MTLEEAMLRHFFHLPDPYALTLGKWDDLLDARRTLRAIEQGTAQQASMAVTERGRFLDRKMGWN